MVGRIERAALALGVGLASSLGVSSASAGPYINIEAVNNFDTCNGPSLQYPIPDADGFMGYMTNPLWNVANYQFGQRWTDFAVHTTDFYDPLGTGCVGPPPFCYDQDHLYFDKVGTAFSYVAAHGDGLVADANCPGPYCQWCYSAADCTNPITVGGVVSTMPSFCRRMPGSTTLGTCTYTSWVRSIAVGNCAAGPPRGGKVWYGQSNWVNWGESNWSGNWAGGGTDGGTNVVILAISHAEMSNRNHEVRQSMAGAHLLLTVLGHAGDTNIVADRGSSFAMGYVINPASAVADGWMDAIPTMSAAGDRCFQNGVDWGGGHGYNGCGGHSASAVDVNEFFSLLHLSEDWSVVKFDSNDATGGGAWAQMVNCNYDCWTWPFGL